MRVQSRSQASRVTIAWGVLGASSRPAQHVTSHLTPRQGGAGDEAGTSSLFVWFYAWLVWRGSDSIAKVISKFYFTVEMHCLRYLSKNSMPELGGDIKELPCCRNIIWFMKCSVLEKELCKSTWTQNSPISDTKDDKSEPKSQKGLISES